MIELDTWVNQIQDWYKTRKHDQGEVLESLITSAPKAVWGPIITDLQSKAIACWLDGCLRIYHYNQCNNPEKAYQYLQFAYSQLQQVVIEPNSQLELKDWCMKRMQHLTVLTLEFCNQQPNQRWLSECDQIINSHVSFMAKQAWNEPQDHSHRNYDQARTNFH